MGELEKWAEKHELWTTLIEMKELLEKMNLAIALECRYIDEQYRRTHWQPVTDVELERAFMGHFGIDEKQLEKERRQLLEDFRKSSEKQEKKET